MALTESKSKVKLKNKSQLNQSVNTLNQIIKNNDLSLIDNKSVTNWWIVFIIIIVISFTTRFHKISEPNHVWYVLRLHLYAICLNLIIMC